MTMLLTPRDSKRWGKESWDAIQKLTDGHPRYNQVRPLSVGASWPPGCYSAKALDLVTVHFDFVGRELNAIVRLQRGAMVALIRALRDAPLDIIVGYGGTGATASYRTCALSDELYQRYKAGIGGRAVPGGQSWHNRGTAADAPHGEKGARALRAQGYEVGEVSGDPSHCTWKTVG